MLNRILLLPIALFLLSSAGEAKDEILTWDVVDKDVPEQNKELHPALAEPTETLVETVDELTQRVKALEGRVTALEKK